MENEGVMPFFTLKRVFQNSCRTMGVLQDFYGPFAVTLEDPWRNNIQNVSCIPEGGYVCERIYSPKFREVFEVTHVYNRSHILFHKGNTEADTHGCILLGERFGVLAGEPAILASGHAFKEFMGKLQNCKKFFLKIKNV